MHAFSIRKFGFLAVALVAVMTALLGRSLTADAAGGSATWAWAQTSYSAPTNSFVWLTVNVTNIVPASIGQPCIVLNISGTGITNGSQTLTSNGTASQSFWLSTTGTAGTATVTLVNGSCLDSSNQTNTATVSGTAAATVVVGAAGGAPVVSSVSPATGPIGQTVTLSGLNFTVGTTAQFVGIPTAAASFTYLSATSAYVVVPAGLTVGNTYNIVVNNGSGTSAQTASFTVTSGTAPVVSGVTPSSGIAGSTVTISGSGFTGTTCPSGVMFGLNPSLSCSVGIGGTTITALVPAGSGIVHVTVTNGNGTSAQTAFDYFTYSGSGILVSYVYPTAGPISGGTTIQFTGTGLNLVNANGITIDGVVCGLTSQTPTTISCTTGIHATAGTYPILVNGAASGFNFTYGSLYTNVTGISPSGGPTTGGTLIQLTGVNLGGVTTVSIDNVACTGVVPATYTVTCTTGYHALSGTYTVYVNGLPTAVTFTYGATGLPSITSVVPASGPASGSPITYVDIYGANFVSVQSVTFGGTAATTYSVIDSTHIQAISPAHAAGTYDIVVTTLAGSSPITLADQFTFTGTGLPVVTGVSPSSGVVGATVIITGSGFTGTIAVRFGGVASTFTVNSDTQITATVPSGVGAGTVDIIVTNAAGSSANTSADNFTNTTPTTTTITYSLYATWTLLAWYGPSGTDIATALSGSSTNSQLNSVIARVTAVLWWDPTIQRYKYWFPAGVGTPGANDFTTFTHGYIFWIAITQGSSLNWTAIATTS